MICDPAGDGVGEAAGETILIRIGKVPPQPCRETAAQLQTGFGRQLCVIACPYQNVVEEWLPHSKQRGAAELARQRIGRDDGGLVPVDGIGTADRFDRLHGQFESQPVGEVRRGKRCLRDAQGAAVDAPVGQETRANRCDRIRLANKFGCISRKIDALARYCPKRPSSFDDVVPEFGR